MKKILYYVLFFAFAYTSFSDEFLELGNQAFENKNYKEAIKYYKKSKTDEGNFMAGVSLQENNQLNFFKKIF